MYQVCTKFLIALSFPVSVSFFAFRAGTFFHRVREPSRSLRGQRWPQGNERFRGGSLHQRNCGYRRPHRGERGNASTQHNVTHIICIFCARIFNKPLCLQVRRYLNRRRSISGITSPAQWCNAATLWVIASPYTPRVTAYHQSCHPIFNSLHCWVLTLFVDD